jgi:hypothetical protein
MVWSPAVTALPQGDVSSCLVHVTISWTQEESPLVVSETSRACADAVLATILVSGATLRLHGLERHTYATAGQARND